MGRTQPDASFSWTHSRLFEGTPEVFSKVQFCRCLSTAQICVTVARDAPQLDAARRRAGRARASGDPTAAPIDLSGTCQTLPNVAVVTSVQAFPFAPLIGV